MGPGRFKSKSRAGRNTQEFVDIMGTRGTQKMGVATPVSDRQRWLHGTGYAHRYFDKSLAVK